MTEPDVEKPMPEVERTARAALDRSVEALPDDVSRRLREARLRALTQAGQPRSPHRTTVAWLGGLAASLALASLLWLQQAPSERPGDEFSEFLDVAQLNEDELEIVDNLEFVYWLSLQEHDEKTPPANG